MITGTIKKNWKMLITVLAAVIGVLAVYQPENAVCYAADNDTSAIEIRTSKDLLEASKNSDGSYVLMADIDMSVFGVDGWKPWNFNGTFDGNGHTLYNMDINTVTDVTEKAYDGNLKEYDTYYAGLFGITKNAVIKDWQVIWIIRQSQAVKWKVMYPSNQQQLCGELRVLQALVTEI